MLDSKSDLVLFIVIYSDRILKVSCMTSPDSGRTILEFEIGK